MMSGYARQKGSVMPKLTLSERQARKAVKWGDKDKPTRLTLSALKENPNAWWAKYDAKPIRKQRNPKPSVSERTYSGPLEKLVTYAGRSIHGQGVSYSIKPGQSELDIGKEAIIKSLKKIQRRIAKAKEVKDEARLIKLTSLETRQLKLLQDANAVKQHADKRSINRQFIREAIDNREVVRIGKRDDKLVPAKRKELTLVKTPVIVRPEKPKPIRKDGKDKKTKKSSEGVWTKEQLDQLHNEFASMLEEE